MRTGGHGRDYGEPLGVDHQVRVIDVGVVNKQGAERPSSGGWRIYKNDYAQFILYKIVGNGNLELNGLMAWVLFLSFQQWFPSSFSNNMILKFKPLIIL